MGTTAVQDHAEWWRPAAPLSPAAEPVAPALTTTRGTLAFASMLTFTLVLLLAPQQFIPSLGVARIAFLAAGLAAAAHAYRCLSEGLPLLRPGAGLGIAGALALWALATAPFSYWPGGSVRMLLGLFFKALIVFWLVASVVDTPERLRRTCLALVLLALPLSLTALHNLAIGNYGDGGNQRILGYEAPLTENPNDLALMLNLIIPLAMGLFLSTSSAITRLLLLSLMGLHAAAVVASFSRGGFLTLATIVAFYSVKLVRRGAWGVLLTGVLLALLALPAVPAGYTDRLATVLDPESDPTGSAQDRSRDLAAALQYSLEHPLVGAGAGMNVLALNDLRGSEWTEVHSVYLQYATDLGLPGLALFLCLLGVSYAGARGAARRAASTPGGERLSALAEGIEVSLAGFAVAAFFHPVGYQFYFFYIAGLAAAARALCPAREPERA